MAIPQITSADFKGWIKIPKGDFTELDNYIAQFQKSKSREIIGDDAYIEADSENYQRWNDLFSGATYENEDGKKVIFDGLNEGVRHFIYFEYIRDNFEMSTNNAIQVESENSKRLEDAGIIALQRNNAGARLVNDQLPLFLENYSEIIEEVTGSTDNGGTYTINVASTLYLENGDIVKINGTNYAASNVVADASFDITEATAGLDFTGENAVWEPFAKVEFMKAGIATFV
jgi:hypothetical protein